MTDQAMNPVYRRQELVRFGHCDPAGIVFYPRYFEMLNALIEDWLTEGLGVNYAELLGPRRVGLPTVQLNTEFKRISRMGERLAQRVSIVKLGRTSLTLRVEFHGSGAGPDLRVGFDQVLVCTSLVSHQPQPFPDDLRAALERARSASHE
ncbi:thioesterase family protein [Paucibacter sp. APW11]|uniref:Thioesterase family protein n=1 Tax=Roseateles aquae TaxID=3077235 RepID=A0ABU3P994_9BURK|nr:thioesterase family protein [Paucibacter sp. APW11]MDT8998306.1 thioesterase family protein [Paucibacter sp. APW11]